MSHAPELYALLVGIDRYHPQGRIRHLRGCVNDVNAMEQLLQQKYGVAATNIQKLTNEDATHQGIKAAFRQHLIQPAEAWSKAGRGGPPPAFVFHYSGHGSQARDETGTEPDGLDETLVAYDSRTPGIYDIKDWELGQLISMLNRYSDNVTIILDCCHSGSGTRNLAQDIDAEPGIALTRRCPPDLRPQPAHSQRPAALAQSRNVSTSNWEVAGQHVLLAGCRDQEESNEYAKPATGPLVNQPSMWRGAMSYFLQQILEELPPTTSLTYRELHERLRYQVNQIYPSQMPQCEGDRDRELFGGVRPQQERFFTIIDKRAGYFWIDGGSAHGFTEGTLLNVYPPHLRTLAAADAPVAQLQIDEVGAVTSGCTVATGDAAAVAINARCVLQRVNYGNQQRSVQIAVADATLQNALIQRLAPQEDTQQIDVSAYLRVAMAAAADFRVVEQAERLTIQDNSGRLLVAPLAKDDLDGIVTDLAHLARYQNALTIRNTAPHSELAGAIQLEMKALAFDPNTQQPLAEALPRTAGGELINTVDTRIVLEITNRSTQDLYLALFNFSPDWSVQQLYPPKGAHEALRAGRTIHLGLSNRRSEQLMAQLPAGMIEGRDVFKVFATVNDTSFEVLEQAALKSPFQVQKQVGMAQTPSALDQVLQSAVAGQQTKAYGPPPASVADEWTTAELTVTTVESRERMTQALQGGARTALPAFALEVEAPTGFAGQVRVVTAQQSTRATNSTVDLQMPLGLAAQPAQFAPLPLAATRAAAPTGAFLEIEADEENRQRITPATPLLLHLNDTMNEEEACFAVAFDGSFYYPVGRSQHDPQTVEVTWLPPADPESVVPLRSTRGVGRVVKLYLYKLLGFNEVSLGLHQVRFVPTSEVNDQNAAPDERAWPVASGVLYYRAVDPCQFQPNERVAVAVPGFSATSQEQAVWLCQTLAQQNLRYDHILTFDYESFNTGISENGQKLSNALRAARLHEVLGLQVDLFAHSMGTVITRCMVELWGGDAFVSRCFLAGPPNQGTRLAEAKQYISWITALALNQVGTWTVAAIGGWVLNKAAEDAVGPGDLRTSSTILHDLNTATKTVSVPYFIIAGTNNQPLHLDATAWQRLQHKALNRVDWALDALFDDQHDLVIGVKSMLGVRNGHYPAHLLATREVNCTHFDYFRDEESQQQLFTWLRQGH
ncbi:MAG: caspase family protein [Caldilineaceae bacterium]|nr:caspase family protein [Caldilineaceae bacterium]